jgi:hypothetical protein
LFYNTLFWRNEKTFFDCIKHSVMQ